MKILIIKFRNIGDVLLTTALFENLKHFFPGASLHFALNSGTQDMILQNPNIDKIHIYQRQKIKKSNFFKRILLEYKFAKELRNEKFDMVIQTTEGDRGLILAKFCGAKQILSINPNLKFFERFLYKKIPPLHYKHTVESNLEFIRALGHEPINKKVRIYFDDFSQKFSNLPENFIHLHLMSRWLFKCLDNITAAKIIDFCELELNIRTVITSDKNELEIEKTNIILQNCQSKPMTFLGNLNLKEVAFLNSKSKLYIGVDTAIMHISAANDVPVIAFFGPSKPYNWGPWDNELNENPYKSVGGVQKMGKHIVIQKDQDCLSCGKAGCNNTRVSDCLINLNLEKIKKVIQEKCLEIFDNQ